MNRITPYITKLETKEIFVFGSNLSGRHGKGAAKTAMNFGAKYGQASGLQGNTYAIPTVAENISRSLSIEEIKPYVDRFIRFARDNDDLIFLVTEIGCGLAGFKPDAIAPLFKNAIEIDNIYLPFKFWKLLR